MKLKEFFDRLEELVKDAKAEFADENGAEKTTAYVFGNSQNEGQRENSAKHIANFGYKMAIANFLLFGKFGYSKNQEVSRQFVIENDEALQKTLSISMSGGHGLERKCVTAARSALQAAVYEAIKEGRQEWFLRDFCYAVNTKNAAGESRFFPTLNLRAYIDRTDGKRDLKTKNDIYKTTKQTISECYQNVNGRV